MAVRVKICGITHPDDAAMAVEEGADALGFVVEYPDANPWIISRQRAAELMRLVPPFVTRVAVAALVDPVARGRPAGTGKAVDWDLARTVVDTGVAPCILAGGLNPGNVGRAVAAVRPFAVDVITAVEDETNRKVRDKVRAFIQAAKAADLRPPPTLRPYV